MQKIFPTLKSFKLGAGLDDSCTTLSVQWCTGGVTGGSWGEGGSDNLRPLSGEPEPDFTSLEEVLFQVAPTISFMLYRKLCRDLSTTSSTSDQDFYGNRTDYMTKSIDVKALYKFLLDHNAIVRHADI